MPIICLMVRENHKMVREMSGKSQGILWGLMPGHPDRAWSSMVEVPYCFSRSYVKFQGHTALKIVEFDPNWVFPDCNSSLNSTMAMECCTKLETAKERCPIVFRGHPSNYKVTRDKTSPILTQIGRLRTIGRSQLSNPSDLSCCKKFIQIWYMWCICN